MSYQGIEPRNFWSTVALATARITILASLTMTVDHTTEVNTVVPFDLRIDTKKQSISEFNSEIYCVLV